MELAVSLVGLLITIPFIVLEAIIKVAMCVIYIPLCIILAIFYPLIENNIKWVKKWWEYASTWKHGFYSAILYKLWKYHN